MTTEQKIEAMTIVSNIQSMQKVIGRQQIGIDAITSYTIEELRSQQNKLIPLYNQAVREGKGDTIADVMNKARDQAREVEKSYQKGMIGREQYLEFMKDVYSIAYKEVVEVRAKLE